ncbi:MAG: hypothetical protein A2946_04200 [Candidatus Liptonbacteria bacterium RIFCSPLOWO2_01_FULL_53_13]|uniref:Nucleotide pyrophosphohydrolase n=1 Tax=Candidatus Liptonbacteria bacterium RIFCSPLOWO2_01_FULL_53_13 TaxID=1798651 RepID=A0A1G2CNB6_9BACT|nr:MAG: hypothetical protein A2946_04200 [Candidatus Liptonbacteria bacterium RIFCSPLOWO2_01_FULL_53_13]
MSDIKKLTSLILKFRKERDWKQFHTPKDMALSLMLEAAEVSEHFQWKNDKEIGHHLRVHKEDICDELADVLFWVLVMSHDFKINIAEAFREKMKKNAKKYPADKVKGKHLKYTEYAERAK